MAGALTPDQARALGLPAPGTAAPAPAAPLTPEQASAAGLPVAPGAAVPANLQPEASPTATAPQPTAAGAVGDALTAFGTQAASTAMLGYDDEIVGLMSKLSGGNYTLARDAYRAGRQELANRSPAAATAGQVVGTVATAALPASAALRGAQTARLAIQGGLAGLGHSNADLTKGEVGQAALDTAIGAGEGAIAGKAAQVVSKAGSGALEAAQPGGQLALPGMRPPAPAGPGVGAQVVDALKGAGKLGGGVGVAAHMAGVGGPAAAVAGTGLAALKAGGAVAQAALGKLMQLAASGQVTEPALRIAMDAGVPERIARGIVSYYTAQKDGTQPPAGAAP